jgi:hypothetical protein
MDTNGHQFQGKETTTDDADVLGSSRDSPNLVKRLSIRRTHIDYYYAFYRIVQPVGDRIVTDDFDLPGLERGILIGIVAFSPRPVPQAVNELHDLLSLTASFRHDFKQIDIQIDLVGLHRRLFSV